MWSKEAPRHKCHFWARARNGETVGMNEVWRYIGESENGLYVTQFYGDLRFEELPNRYEYQAIPPPTEAADETT